MELASANGSSNGFFYSPVAPQTWQINLSTIHFKGLPPVQFDGEKNEPLMGVRIPLGLLEASFRTAFGSSIAAQGEQLLCRLRRAIEWYNIRSHIPEYQFVANACQAKLVVIDDRVAGVPLDESASALVNARRQDLHEVLAGLCRPHLGQDPLLGKATQILRDLKANRMPKDAKLPDPRVPVAEALISSLQPELLVAVHFPS